MRQQVNLYQPMFRRSRRVFSARAMLQSLALAVLGLTAMYAYGAWQVASLETRVSSLAGQQEAALERLTGVGGRLPQRRMSKLLASRVAAVELEIGHRRGLVEMLAQRIVDDAGGFSAFFQGLSRQRVDGLWLTGLHIAEGGRHLEINGSALRPELVPVLVQRLSAEKRFDGLAFNALTMDRSMDSPQRIDFVLATAMQGESEP